MAREKNQNHLISTARTAGIWYLGMAISGILGFMVFHSQVFVNGDPQTTLSNLIDKESTARIRILLEFAIIVTQALTALWFYRLFRHINEWAAWAVGIWGMVNSIMIMVSAISMGTALGLAQSTSQAPADNLIIIELLTGISSNAWGVGSLFFGLWLIPLGYIITSSRRMPVWLGRTLIIGGIAYLLSATLNYGGIETPISDYLVIPASVGEFWMIGYLLIFGIRREEEGG